MILYHATYLEYLPSILQNGLQPDMHSNWDEEENDGLIFLSTDEDVAYSFCEAADLVPDDVYNSGIIVIYVDTTNIDSTIMENDPNVIDDQTPSIAYRGVVSPSAFANLNELQQLI